MNKELMTQRIAENLEHLKQFTATPNKGCTRLPFTKEARDAANYIKDIMQKAGLEVKEDEAGNVFGFIYGSDTSLPCVMMGSHYDSVVNGGDYDGIAGVICAMRLQDSSMRKIQLLSVLLSLLLSVMKKVCVLVQVILALVLCLLVVHLNTAKPLQIKMM